MPHPRWPLFDLRIRTPRLELRPDWDEGLAKLADLAAAGIHDPAFMPFTTPWSDAAPDHRARSVFQWSWKHRAELTPEKWSVSFLVTFDGQIVGTQGVLAEHFATLRVVETGSWLGLSYQGLGIGKEMRGAVLRFAFDGLGARAARSGAFENNAASLAVSRALGYEDNGESWQLRRDDPGRILHLQLTRERWEEHRPGYPIEIEGLAPCLPLLVGEPPG